MMSACPTTEVWDALLASRLSDQDEAILYQHCMNCVECKRLFSSHGESRRTPSPPVRPPQEFDHYIVVRPLGRGAMGQVYVGRDTHLDRPVAIKFLGAQAATERERARFLVEARAIARLTHPNVVAIYRVGEEGGWPYLVSELVDGRSLDKVQKPLPPAQVLRIALGIARGLAAAHQAGVLHRDIKPANVMLTSENEAKLLDFGLAKLLEESGSIYESYRNLAEDHDGASSLTATGALIGTPLYLAPELWRGEPATPGSDVYALGALLYELSTGIPPHFAPTVKLLRRVVPNLDAPPVAAAGHPVDPHMAAIIDRCLRRDQRQRFTSAQELCAALERAQEATRPPPRVFGLPFHYTLIVLFVMLAIIVYGGTWLEKSLDRARRMREHVEQAQLALAAGRAHREKAALVERDALVLFDAKAKGPNPSWERAEQRLANANDLVRETDAAYAQASQMLERALLLDVNHQRARALFAEVTYERILLLESTNRQDQFGELYQRLVGHDDEGRRQRLLNAPASLSIDTALPVDAALQRFEEGRGYQPLTTLGALSLVEMSLAPGSYRLRLGSESFPLLLKRGVRERLSLPPRRAVPEGYVRIPAGCFLSGSAEQDDFRRSFLTAPPLHQVCTAEYLIARHEVTFGDWLHYLRALPAKERARRTPQSPQSEGRHMLRLSELPGGGWELRFQPGARVYSARAGQPIRYEERTRNAVQDWLRFPVSCISLEDAQAYLGWLDRTGRLPGARLCDEQEWERAARGVDGRLFPHGARLAPDDANFDETYGRAPNGYGPDEVGLHPASDSPYGLSDMAGNAFEWTRSSRSASEVVTRGGSWYYSKITARTANREVSEATLRDINLGLRVCATP